MSHRVPVELRISSCAPLSPSSAATLSSMGEQQASPQAGATPARLQMILSARQRRKHLPLVFKHKVLHTLRASEEEG